MNIEKSSGQGPRRLIIAVASLLIAGLLLFLFLPRNPGPYRALPAQSSLVLECDGLLRAKILIDKTADPRWREVLHSPLFERCFSDADAAIKLLGHDPQVLRAFAKNKALAAFSLHAADSLHALFVLEMEGDFDLEKWLKTNKLTPKYFPHQFHGNDIFNVHFSRLEQLEVAASGRLLLFSRSATLVEDALAQLENARNWWTDRPYISELPAAPLRLQLRPAALAEQWRNQMNARWRGLPDLLARNLEWAGLSWDGKEVKAAAETRGFFSGLGNWGKTPGNAIFATLPDNTAFLARVGLGKIPDFFRQIGEERSGDFEQYVLPWVGAEAALVVTEPLSPALAGDRLVLLAVQDSAKALSSLQAFGKARGTMPASTGPYQMFDLMGFQNASLLKPILGDDEAFRNPVCVLVGGYAVFAPDRSSLEIFLDKYLVNQTLSTNVDFLQLQQKLPPQGFASFLMNTAYLRGLLQNISDHDGESPLAKTGFLLAEWQPNLGRKTEIVLANQPLSRPLSETDILWKTVFAAPVITPPYLVEQPGNKLVALSQDLKFKLYCLDAENGAIIWSKPLQDRIISDIEGVDFYGNGTKCFSFSSANQIYMIDENGRDVQGFPLKLPAPATNAARVVDFDQNTKFSFFVACENGKIYGFGHLGKPLDGWNGLPSNGVVKQPILHFQHKGKDYLAVLTEAGLLSVYGRDGAERFATLQLPADGGKFTAPMQVDEASLTPRIYCANTEGKIFACDVSGKVMAQQVGGPGSVAAFGQLTGDAAFEWAVLGEKTLKISSWGKGKQVSAYKAGFPEKKPLLFFPDENRIGVVDIQRRRVWLIDSNGNILPGFPLGGNTPFEFGRLNGVDMLVVGNVNGVWAYRSRL